MHAHSPQSWFNGGRSRAIWVYLAMSALVLGSSCDGCDVSPSARLDAGGLVPPSGDAGTLADGGDPIDTDGGGPPPPMDSWRLQIDPSPGLLDATVGGDETLTLAATLINQAGVRRTPDSVFWGSLHPEVGTVGADGVFRPSRERAGTARVRARAEGIEGTTEVTVRLREESVLDGSSAQPGDFSGPLAGSGSVEVLYPEDGVVIPANLAPLLFQWQKQRARARVLLQGAHGQLALYTDRDRAQPETTSWRRFLVAHVGESFTVTIEETEGAGSERVSRTLTIHLADADLRSTVYYWAVDQGRIVRIDADSTEPVTLDIPYETGAGTGASGSEDVNCRACHALSADGQHMAFTYFGGNGPGGVVDPGALAAPILPNRDDRRWNFAALSPDGSLLLANYQNRLSLRSGLTGQTLIADITGFDVAHPAFSPIGNRFAFAGQTRMNGSSPGWEVDFNRSALFVANIDAATTQVSGLRQVVPDEGEALFYPSFNPDGRLLAYTKGPHSRSAYLGSNLRGDLYLASIDDIGSPNDVPRVALARANPGQNSYLPTFNPKVEGGYQWVAFYSRRDYGHVLRGVARPQIWVAAIDENADPTLSLNDPSHPAFWLPGQNIETENLSSFFAPRPCSNAGGSCDTDGACCGDLLCRPVGTEFQCVPPTDACSLTGAPCEDDGSCCDGLLCGFVSGSSASTCLPPGEVCSESGQICQLDADCCDTSQFCADDGTGTTRCLAAMELPCAQVGESCSNRACCEGAGQCITGSCIIVGG